MLRIGYLNHGKEISLTGDRGSLLGSIFTGGSDGRSM
jgi:hypothetical protein